MSPKRLASPWASSSCHVSQTTPSSCAALAKSPNGSVPQSPHLCNGDLTGLPGCPGVHVDKSSPTLGPELALWKCSLLVTPNHLGKELGEISRVGDTGPRKWQHVGSVDGGNGEVTGQKAEPQMAGSRGYNRAHTFQRLSLEGRKDQEPNNF